MGDGAAVSPFAVRTSPNSGCFSSSGSPRLSEGCSRASHRPEAVSSWKRGVFESRSDRHGASARDRARSRGGLGHCGVFCGCSHPSRFQRWERAGKADRPGGGVSFRGRERERIELHLGMTEEPAERLCVRLKRQLEMVPTAVRPVLMVGSRSFLQCVKEEPSGDRKARGSLERASRETAAFGILCGSCKAMSRIVTLDLEGASGFCWECSWGPGGESLRGRLPSPQLQRSWSKVVQAERRPANA
ncbi:uncharacterized protein LOC121106536 isoform X3 [Gallus gallus]|uniref:uncharacterized protein LOC121106536 isoform X3 n=1 Tax=Gallus gallus TaxID=9031 RepID=UPI001F007000|nr:uncharacterized protein LOC121106536 isoform X3 [Gallus gallus]